MPTNSAEYMREYRANRKKKAPADPATETGSGMDVIPSEHVAQLVKDNNELVEEVKRLKREIARLNATTPTPQPVPFIAGAGTFDGIVTARRQERENWRKIQDRLISKRAKG